MAELAVRGLTVDRSGVRALEGIDLDIHADEVVAIMGGTGAGKSTLALALCGLLDPTAGHVGGDAAGQARLVLQRPESSLLAETVIDEIALAARARGETIAQAEQRATSLIAELGLPADLARRDPLALSGGEQRRVSVAAVLAADPRVLVLDEPGAGLDRAARTVLHDAIARLHVTGRRTIVLVTHDPHEAAELATRLVVLQGGRIAYDGPPNVVLDDPVHAAQLGLAPTAEIEVLAAVAAARGVAMPDGLGTWIGPLDAIASILKSRSDTHRADTGDRLDRASPPPHGTTPLPPLPALVDARVRLFACALAVTAALLSTSLVAAAITTFAAAVVVGLARIGRARVRLAVRPLLALLVLLVALQLLFGGAQDVTVAPGIDTTHPVAAPLLRALQAAAIVLATLALSAATPVADLATGLRRVFAPLRVLRIPVGSIAFVVAIGLGLVPAFADELERLRLAQRARGIRRHDAGPVARLRADATLVAPLFVAAFRRAHLLADALAVRGVDPDTDPPDWRPRRTPGADVALLGVAALLVAMTRFT